MKCTKCNGTGVVEQVEYTPPFERFTGSCNECDGKGFKTKNIEAHEKNQELFFVGYTNGAQVLYASEDEGSFYSNTENECFIPLYMLKTHEHRLEGNLTSGLNFETVLKVRGIKDS